jgi:hypothetical protein
MHARELVELAALVATHAEALVKGPDPIPDGRIEEYWVASRTRFDRWARALKRLGSNQSGASSQKPGIPLMRSVLEEIVTGEVLTRVWAAAMAAYDHHRDVDMMAPVARSVFLSQLEARNRVLAAMVCSPNIGVELAVKVNRLRRRVERWTDVLIGAMAELQGTEKFAFDPDRARDFGEDLRYQQSQEGGRQAWPLTLASLIASFGQGLDKVSPNPDLNVKIAASILACFPPGMFDSTGVFRSAWLLRVACIAQDTQGMIEELLSVESQPRAERQTRAGRFGISDQRRRFRS